MTRVLIVDDEPQLVRALTTNLAVRGYETHAAISGEDALDLAARWRPDLVILDLGLPGISGIEVIDAIRGWSAVPILVLSVRDDELDKVRALDAGANDYVTKPFGMEELLARVRAATRQATPVEGTPLVVAEDFTVDLAGKEVRSSTGEQVRLTPTEWHVLEVLARNQGKLVSQRYLLQEVWGPNYETETHYLRVYLAQLRRKLERDPARPRCLITEPGMGYRLLVASSPPGPGVLTASGG